MRIRLFSTLFVVCFAAISLAQDVQNPEQVRTLEAKIAQLHAELTALKQQITTVADLRQEDIPPPQPAPAQAFTAVTANEPTLAQLPAPHYVDAPPVVPPIVPPYSRPSIYAPNYCPQSVNSGFGYGGVGFTIGGLDFGFYPSFGFSHGHNYHRSHGHHYRYDDHHD